MFALKEIHFGDFYILSEVYTLNFSNFYALSYNTLILEVKLLFVCLLFHTADH
jgi:hypothetical protein